MTEGGTTIIQIKRQLYVQISLSQLLFSFLFLMVFSFSFGISKSGAFYLQRLLQLFYFLLTEGVFCFICTSAEVCVKKWVPNTLLHPEPYYKEIKFEEKKKIINIFHATYRGKTDSTPTPATSLRNLNVVFKPALRLAITVPLSIEARRLFSGTTCSYQGSKQGKQVKTRKKQNYHTQLQYHPIGKVELHNCLLK